MEDEFSLICGEIIRSLDEIIGLVLVWVRFMWRLKAKGCRSAPKAPSTWSRSSNVGLVCPIFAHARSETEEDLYNHTGQKMITGPMHIKYILWGNCSLSASLALLPLLGLGSSLTLVLLLLLRPTCPTLGRVHLIGAMRSDFCHALTLCFSCGILTAMCSIKDSRVGNSSLRSSPSACFS